MYPSADPSRDLTPPASYLDAGLHAEPRPRYIYCLGCGYDLQGLGAGDCPECGRGFDPAVLSSYTSHVEPAWVAWLPSRRIGYAIGAAGSLLLGRAVLLGWNHLADLQLVVGFLYPFWAAVTTALLIRAATDGRDIGYPGTVVAGMAVGAVLGLPDFPLGQIVAMVMGAAAGFFFTFAQHAGMVRG